MDEQAHKKLDTLLEIVTGNGDPSRGVVVRLDRTERLAESNAESIAEISANTTAFQRQVADWQTKANEECSERAQRLHKRIDQERVGVAHDIAPVKEQVHKLHAESKAAKTWIRAAVWIAAPIFTGLVGLLFYFVKQMLDKLASLPVP